MALALAIFIMMYVLLLVFSEKRWIIALCAAALFLVLGILPVSNVVSAINWNVLLMLVGTMVTVQFLLCRQHFQTVLLSQYHLL